MGWRGCAHLRLDAACHRIPSRPCRLRPAAEFGLIRCLMSAPQSSPVRRSLWLLGLTIGLGSCAHAPRQEAPLQLPASVPRTWESPPLRANLAALGVTSLDVAAPLNSTEALAAA